MKQFTLLFALLILVTGLSAYTHYWQGDVSTSWNTASNWNDNMVPTYLEDAQIPSDCPRYPMLNANSQCRDLRILAGASVTLNNYNMSVFGVLDVTGTLIMTGTGDLSVAESVFWNSGSQATITNSSAVITVAGNMTFGSGSNIQMSSGEIQFAGETALTWLTNESINTQINKITITKAVGTTFSINDSGASQPFTIKSTLQINSGITFTNSYPGDIYLKGSLMDYNSTTGGVMWDNGTLVANGTAQQTFRLAGINSYLNKLTLSQTGSGSVTLSMPLSIKGDLLIESGILKGNAQTINVAGDWDNAVGTAGFEEGTSTVCFNGTANQSVSSETFNNLKLDKPSGDLEIGSAAIGCNSYDWAQGGYSISGGSFIVQDLVDPGIMGTIKLYSGTIEYHQDSFSEVNLRGNLTINGGSLTVYGGSSTAYFSYLSDIATLTMTNGTLDFSDQGITIPAAVVFNDNISGGTIQTSKSFLVQRTGFNPSGGTILLYGSSDCTLQNTSGSNFHNILINKSSARDNEALRSNTVNANGPFVINGNFTLQAGFFVAPTSIQIKGNWENTAGPAAFNEGTGSVEFIGINDQYCNNSEDFHFLNLNKGSGRLKINGSTAFITCDIFTWTQGIIHIMAGTCNIDDFSTSDIQGYYYVESGATLGLRKNALTYLYMNAYLYNYGGTINFSGGDEDCTWAGSNNAGISMTGGVIDFKDTGIIVPDFNTLNLNLTGGTIRTIGSFTSNRVTVAYGSASFELYGSGEKTISMYSGTSIKNLLINKSGSRYEIQPISIGVTIAEDQPQSPNLRDNSVTLSNNLILTGSLTVAAGTLNLNNKTLRVGGNIIVSGILQLGYLARLEMNAGKSLTVNNGGVFSLLGSPSQPATITHVTGTYAFNVNSGGTLQANYAIFEYMDANGINIKSGALLDANSPMSNCIFRNGASVGTLITINNSQTVTIIGAIFQENTWSGTSNVKKTVDQGIVNFSGSTGAFAGESYDNDTYNRINWGVLAQVPAPSISYLSASNHIQLSWTYPDPVSRFRIYRCSTSNGTFGSVGTSVSTSWSETLPGSTFYYRVTAELD